MILRIVFIALEDFFEFLVSYYIYLKIGLECLKFEEVGMGIEFVCCLI